MDNIKLVQCYHCYALADHKRPNCPLLSKPQRCPRCGQFGHKSWECQNHTVCLHCGGPHPVTAPCCPTYRKKLEEHKPKILAELLTDANTPQNFSNKNNEDALNLLTTSALTANGSFISFVNSLFTASLNLCQPSNPIVTSPPYSLPLVYNSDWEASSHCLSRSTSSLDTVPEELVNSPTTSLDPLSNLLTPSSDPGLLHPATDLDPIHSPAPVLSHDPIINLPTPTSELPSDSSLLQPEIAPDTDCSTLSQPQPCTHLEPSLDTKPITEENATEAQQTCWAQIHVPYIISSTEDTLLEALIEENPQAGILTTKEWVTVTSSTKGLRTPLSTIKVKFKGTEPPHEIYHLEVPYTTKKLC